MALGVLPDSDREREADEAGRDERVVTTVDTVVASPVSASHAVEPPPPLPRGTNVGRYVVLSSIGVGGMGVVYKAYDPELDRRVALKLLRVRSVDADARADASARLLREAQALAKLAHPNVIAVYDVGTFEDDVFVAMELVEGPTLREWQKAARRTRQEIIAVFMAAGRGLAAAHRAGLIHRDFKPDNVLVGDDGRVRVLDFGLARAAASAADEEEAIAAFDAEMQKCGKELYSPLTVTGMLMGTPVYMSPEQHARQPADARSDQFAFCLALYEALHSERLFDGQTYNEIQTQVVSSRSHDLPKHAAVPSWLRSILVRGLRRDPARRYPDMETLLAALARDPAVLRRRVAGVAAVVAVTAVAVLAVADRDHEQRCTAAAAKLDGVWDDARKQAMREAFVATGVGYAADSWRGVERELDQYSAAWVAMRTEACRATREQGEQSRQLLDLRMACLDTRLQEVRALGDLFITADAALVERAVSAASAISGLAECADSKALTSPVAVPGDVATRIEVAGLRDTLAEVRALQLAGKYELGLGKVGAVVDRAGELGYAPLSAEALLLCAELQEDKYETKKAEDSLYRALWAAIRGRDDATAARAASQLINVVGVRQRRREDGHRWHQLAAALHERLGPDRAREILILRHRGALATIEDDFGAAVEHSGKALALRESLAGAEDPEVIELLAELGSVLISFEQPGRALEHYRRAIDLAIRVHGRDHPEVANLLSRQATAYRELGDYQLACDLNEQALQRWEKAFGPDHPQIAVWLVARAAILDEMGRVEEAVAAYRRALTIHGKNFGPGASPSEMVFGDVARTHLNLGEKLVELDELDEAEGHLERALEIYEQGVGADHEYIAYPLDSLAELARHRGQLDRALALNQRALAMWEQRWPNKPVIAPVLVHRSETHLDRREPGLAIDFAERALAICTQSRCASGVVDDARFALARALWRSKGDRKRARSLGEAARAGYVALAAGSARAAVVAEWLQRPR